MSTAVRALWLAFGLLLCSTLPVHAEIAQPDNGANADLRAELRGLLASIESNRNELTQLRAQRAQLQKNDDTDDLDEAIDTTSSELKSQRQEFLQLATNDFNITVDGNSKPPIPQLDWQQDLAQVLHPFLQELQLLTVRPREIERIGTEIRFYRNTAESLRKDSATLHALIPSVRDPELLQTLQQLLDKITSHTNQVQGNLTLLERELALQNEGPRDVLRTILKNLHGAALYLGLYLVLAILAAATAYYGVQLLGKLLRRALRQSHSSREAFIDRVIHLIEILLGSLLATIAFLLTLYAVSAWALLTLFIVIGIGIALSFRSMIPAFVIEIRTLLNLGTVRQNERLIFNGLPWRIAALDIQVILHNAALSGYLRVPLTQISRLSSRPFHEDEPWFPTHEGDYVLMQDGLFGRIAMQTTEMVQLNYSESIVTYPIDAFLNQRPQNISINGFTAISDIGLDYCHRNELESIETILRSELSTALATTAFGAFKKSLTVEFKAANSSSLDFRILVVFSGEASEFYLPIHRWLQKFGVDCANRHTWSIPFPQLTLHYADTATPQ